MTDFHARALEVKETSVDIFRRRILAKLIIILIVAVSAISILSILYFDRRNKQALKKELQDTVSNLGEMERRSPISTGHY